MSEFFAALALQAGVAAAAAAAGWLASPAVCPPGRPYRLERAAWSWALGAGMLAAMVPLSFLARIEPGWPAFLVLAASTAAAARLLRVKGASEPAPPSAPVRTDAALWILGALVLLGVLLYLLRALTEPMWANDYMAIWGLKGKTIHAAAGVLRRLFEDPSLGFSHPEYPLGLPFLYAGASFLTGRWDDHAMALLFPIFQLATLAALLGWLRRQGASRGVALFATAILACFEPLYSAFLTGMAEVPLSLGLLLFGSSIADAHRGEPGSLRRIAAASALITATKNEGLFFAVAGCGIALLLGGERRWKIAFSALPTALVVQGLHMAWRGQLSLRDFDFTSFSFARAGEALGAAARLPGVIGWAELLMLAALLMLGRRSAQGALMLALAACAMAVYLILPAFAVRGPEWLVTTALPRTSAGLVPLVAAAVAIRYGKQADLTGHLASEGDG